MKIAAFFLWYAFCNKCKYLTIFKGHLKTHLFCHHLTALPLTPSLTLLALGVKVRKATSLKSQQVPWKTKQIRVFLKVGCDCTDVAREVCVIVGACSGLVDSKCNAVFVVMNVFSSRDSDPWICLCRLVVWNKITFSSLLPVWVLNVSVALLSVEGQKALGFHQKYIYLCSEDELNSYRFRITWGWVIHDRIVIFGWTWCKNGPYDWYTFFLDFWSHKIVFLWEFKVVFLFKSERNHVLMELYWQFYHKNKRPL